MKTLEQTVMITQQILFGMVIICAIIIIASSIKKDK